MTINIWKWKIGNGNVVLQLSSISWHFVATEGGLGMKGIVAVHPAGVKAEKAGPP